MVGVYEVKVLALVVVADVVAVVDVTVDAESLATFSFCLNK
jgi:hypothetical protein